MQNETADLKKKLTINFLLLKYKAHEWIIFNPLCRGLMLIYEYWIENSLLEEQRPKVLEHFKKHKEQSNWNNYWKQISRPMF